MKSCDLFIIGGGINGCGIARDAAGRGLDVILAERNDLASATSSASTKLFHGGLRYLEYFEFRLVREALAEREVLLRAMPHISWPLRFVLPYHQNMRFDVSTPASRLLSFVFPWMKSRRPAWLIRLGLLLYDTLGNRTILPSTQKIDLVRDPAGRPLRSEFRTAFEYSDCWVQDSRLVVLNARDAKDRGALILPRTQVQSVERSDRHWIISVLHGETGNSSNYRARAIVNASGPWVGKNIRDLFNSEVSGAVRLVRGSHIVVKRLYEHDKCYIFQGQDGRIVFAIPYEEDFTLIGTTDINHSEPDDSPQCSDTEKSYLLDFVSGYFDQPVAEEDIVWSYSGIRPLFDSESKSATAATRDYVLELDSCKGAPVLHVFGGKITTYRRLAEAAMDKFSRFFPGLPGSWTREAPLPGGDFEVENVKDLVSQLRGDFAFLNEEWSRRLVRTYGTDAWKILGNAQTIVDVGTEFGATITSAELDWAIENEWVKSAEDFIWRRTKLGLKLSRNEIQEIETYISVAVNTDFGASRGHSESTNISQRRSSSVPRGLSEKLEVKQI